MIIFVSKKCQIVRREVTKRKATEQGTERNDKERQETQRNDKERQGTTRNHCDATELFSRTSGYLECRTILQLLPLGDAATSKITAASACPTNCPFALLAVPLRNSCRFLSFLVVSCRFFAFLSVPFRCSFAFLVETFPSLLFGVFWSRQASSEDSCSFPQKRVNFRTGPSLQYRYQYVRYR